MEVSMKKKLISYILILLITLFSLNSISLKSLDNYYITSTQDFINYLLSDDADMEGSYILTTDLDFTKGIVTYNGVTYDLEKVRLVVNPIGERMSSDGKILSSYYNPFKGSFNGGGYVIKGLIIKSAVTDNEYVGLFGYNQGIISNLGLVDSVVEGGIHVGGIAGYNMGIIMGCYNNSTITGIGTVGGITGINYGYIRNCYNTGFVGGATKVGGIVGQNSSVVSAVYDLGIISGEITEDGRKEYGYIFGYNTEQGVIGYVESDEGLRFFNPYQAYEVAGAYYSLEYDIGVGYNEGYLVNNQRFYNNVNVIGKSLEELKNLDTYDAGFKNPKYNIHPIGSNLIHQTLGFYIRENSTYRFPVVGTSERTTKDHIENSLNKNGFTGSGTIYNPFLIKNEEDLQNISKSLTSAYKIVNNIEITKPFTPIGTEENEFKGILNGNGKRIFNLQIDTSLDGEYLGLFALNSGIIHNLSIDVKINALNATKVGGIAGLNNGQIYEVYVLGEIKADSTVGGIVGANEQGIIKNSYNKADIYGKADVGGIAGYNSGKIEFVYNANNPQAITTDTVRNVGAIVGYNENTNNPNNVCYAIYYEIDQIGYQTKNDGPYNNFENKVNTIAELKNISLYSNFDLTLVDNTSNITTIWAKEDGVNDNLPYLVNTPPIRVESIYVDKAKELMIDGTKLKLFSEDGILKLGSKESYANTLDLNEIVYVLPLNAENKKINYYVVSGEENVILDGSILKGQNSGNAKIKAVSEDGKKEAFIDVMIIDRINEFYFVDQDGNIYDEAITVENLSSISIIPKSNLTTLNPSLYTLTISQNDFVINQGNNLYFFNYDSKNNVINNGLYQNEVSVVYTISSKENSSITKTLKIILKPSSKTYTSDLITLIENSNTLNYVVNNNKIVLQNNQQIRYSLDFVTLKINPNFLQKVKISSNTTYIVDENETTKKLYLTKGNVVDGKYLNRENEIIIEIIAEDGTRDIYTLELIKGLSPINEIKEISFSDGQKNYEYERIGNKFIIHGYVGYDVEFIYLNASLADINSEYSKSLTHKFYYYIDSSLKSEYGIIKPKKDYSKETIYLEVVSETNETKVYEIEFLYDFSKNDKLADLFIGEYGKENKINFSKDVNNYHIQLNSYDSLNLFLSYETYPGSNQVVFVIIDSSEMLYANNINFVASNIGLTFIWIYVQSRYNYENGIPEYNLYLVSIEKIKNNEANLEELSINSNAISIDANMNYALDKTFNGYALINLSVSKYANVEVTYLSFTEKMSQFTYNYNLKLNSNDNSYQILIDKGGNYRLEIVVTSEDKLNSNTYYLTISKEPTTNPLVEKIIIDGKEYTNFQYDNETNTYFIDEVITFPYEKGKISLIVYFDANGYYELNNFTDLFISGEVVEVDLKTGLNNLQIVTYAENYYYYAIYQISIKREYNSNTLYKVIHYKQNFDGTYSPFQVEELRGTAYDYVSATPLSLTGFTFDQTIVDTVMDGIILEDGSLVLKLFYKRNIYNLSINYDSNYGEVLGEYGQIKYDYNISLKVSPKKGYKFIGWYVGDTLVSSNFVYEFKMPAYDLEVFAKFELETYIITYILYDGINNPLNKTTYTFLDLDLPLYEPTKVGYKFLGWYLNSDYNGESVEKIDLNLLGNITLYARWLFLEEENYQVYIYKEALDGSFSLETIENYSGYVGGFVQATLYEYLGFTFNASLSLTSGYITSGEVLVLSLYYNRLTYQVDIVNENPNSGEVNIGSYLLKYEENLNLKAIVYPGYEFLGWYLNDELISSDTNYTYTCLANNVTITSKFTIKTFKITYVLDNDAIHTNQTSFNILNLPLNLKPAQKEGYTFLGWYFDQDFKEKVDIITSDLLSDLTLYAQFIVNEYTVNLIIDGVIIDRIVVKYKEKIPFNDYSQLGYRLNAWYTDANLINKWDEESLVTNNLTLYGTYDLIEYSITYHLNGGKEVIANPRKYTYISEEIILNPLEKEGYIFIGWYDANDNLVEKINTNSIGDLELYAKFEIIKCTLNFVITGKGKVILNQIELSDLTVLIEYGSKIILEFVPYIDFEIASIIINEIEYQDVNTIEIDNVTKDYVIEVNFIGSEPNCLTLIEGSGYGNKVYQIDRSNEINLFLNYYLGQSVKAIRECFVNSPERIKFYNTALVELNDDAILGTGYIIRLYNHDYSMVLDEVYVVLVGDTNCDGYINALDVNIVLRHVKLLEIITAIPILIAANPENLPLINAACVNTILRHVKLLELLYT